MKNISNWSSRKQEENQSHINNIYRWMSWYRWFLQLVMFLGVLMQKKAKTERQSGWSKKNRKTCKIRVSNWVRQNKQWMGSKMWKYLAPWNCDLLLTRTPSQNHPPFVTPPKDAAPFIVQTLKPSARNHWPPNWTSSAHHIPRWNGPPKWRVWS